jgi:hypothetical protein
MKQRLTTAIVVTMLVLTGGASSSVKAAQGATPPSLREQLLAQYKLAKMGSDSGGRTLVEEGTLLVLQKGGVLGVPQDELAVCPAKYKDGDLRGASGLCASMVNNVSRLFKSGEKVYPYKIDVDEKKDKVTVSVISCDACNRVNPPSYFKAAVTFEFPKGTLTNANIPQVEDTIAQVFAIDSASPQ